MEPRFVTHEQARSFYDRIGRAQDARPLSERRALDAVAALGDFASAASVVEFGCGTGRFAARLLRDALPASATYLAVDVSPRMVQLARAAVAPWAGRARVELTDGAMHLPVADASCDRVVSTYVLDLLSPMEAEEFVAEARRALRPGGLLALASLAQGRTAPARLVTALWRAVWRLNPALLGGCRPLALRGLLQPHQWDVRAGMTVTDWFLSSEVCVARRRRDDARSASPPPGGDHPARSGAR
jgi:SAM-dependent methyltransferase